MKECGGDIEVIRGEAIDYLKDKWCLFKGTTR
jgi:hypothetical protein